MSAINKKQILIGISVLFIGLLIYFIDRPGDTYLVGKISGGTSFHGTIPGLFGQIGYVLPAFIHIFSFSLITCGLLGCGRKGAIIVCTSWLVVNFAFELGQKFKSLPVSIIEKNYPENTFFEIFSNYFRFGTFDKYDLVAFVIGALAAYLTMSLTIQRREKDVYQ